MARIEFVDSVRRQGACGTWSAIMLRDGTRCSAMRLPVLVTDRATIGRIVSATRALVRAKIPGVAPVADVAVGGDQVWIFVGIAPGPSVGDLLHDVALTPADAALIAVDAGEVLAALHGNGLRHGAFGPETIVVSRSGEVRVTEAGLAHALAPRASEDPAEAARADVKAWADAVRILATHVRTGGHRGAAEALEECAHISAVGGLAAALSALDRAGFDFPGFPSRGGLRDTMSRYGVEDEPSTEKILSAIDALFAGDVAARKTPAPTAPAVPVAPAAPVAPISPAGVTTPAPNRGPATPPRDNSGTPTNAPRTAPVPSQPSSAPTSPPAGGSPVPAVAAPAAQAPAEEPPAGDAEVDRPASPAPVGATPARGSRSALDGDGGRDTVGLAPVSPTRLDMPSSNGSGGRRPAGSGSRVGQRPSLFTPSAANMAAAAKAGIDAAASFAPPAEAPDQTTGRRRRTTPIPLAATGTSVPAPPRPDASPAKTPPAQAAAAAAAAAPATAPAAPAPAPRSPLKDRETVRTAPAKLPTRPSTVPPPVSAPPAAPTAPRPAVAGPSALVHTVRFGSGVPTQPKTRPAPARVGRPRRWPRILVNLLLTAAILGGVTFFVISRLHDPLQVTGVTLTVNKHFGKQCELDADVVGTITTTGGPGVLTYQWRRSDGTATDVYTARVGGSSEPTIVHLRWVFRGTGQETADVSLSILGPQAQAATTSFNYICAG